MDNSKLRKLAGLPPLSKKALFEQKLTESNDDLDFSKLLDKYMAQERMYSFEGRRGLINLARLCRAIGYRDDNGQMAHDASIGDITQFLEDNSGAIVSIVEWMRDINNHEWEENIKQILADDDNDDSEDDGNPLYK